MMKKIALIICLIPAAFSMAQPAISWGPEIIVADGAAYGNVRPRIALTEDNVPVVIWGKGAAGILYTARFNGSNFNMPVSLLPANVETYLTSWTGPDIAAKGDTVIAVFKSLPLETGHVLSVRSTDGGITWSDTIRTDSHNNGGVAWLPSMDIDENGNPSVIYMAHDPLWSVPRYVVSHSTDQGVTYQPEMNIATSIADEACDCCPAEYVIEGNQHALLFRNNASNVRDIHAVYSDDDGVTYPETANVDQLNWNVSSCPSTGPDGMFNNGTLLTAYASRESGSYRVYLSETATNPSLGFSARTMMTPPTNTNGTQNFPRIDGSNDTIVMVWQESETSNYEIFAAISTSADPNQLIGTKGMVNVSTTGTQSNPDILYSAGMVHVVYQDSPTGSVIYRRGTVSMVGLGENAVSEISVYPNPNATGTFLIKGAPDSIQLFDNYGKAVEFDAHLIQGQTFLVLSEELHGVFHLRVSKGDAVSTIKLIRL
jgi:hypothetical protein